MASNPEAANKAIADLYQQEEINPLAGCLPTIAQIPIFISLYRALLNLAKEDKLAEPFLWLPSLEGPVYQAPPTETLRWLNSGWDGFTPPLGWHDTLCFLTIPIILVISQSISQQLMQPPQQKNQQSDTSQAVLKYLPLLIGWFSLNVPSGLGVYWIINNFLSTSVSVFIRNQISAEKGLPTTGFSMGNMMGGAEAPSVSSSSLRNTRDDAEEGATEKPKGFAVVSDDEIEGEIVSADDKVAQPKVKAPKSGGSSKKKRRNRK
ncbi:unnamed protein product [Phaeothamnion confervicola]